MPLTNQAQETAFKSVLFNYERQPRTPGVVAGMGCLVSRSTVTGILRREEVDENAAEGAKLRKMLPNQSSGDSPAIIKSGWEVSARRGVMPER